MNSQDQPSTIPPSTAVQKWADQAMFKAAPINQETGPTVQLLSCNNDPLGTIAAAALMYEGQFVQSLAEITDAQRRYYLEQVQKSALEAPLEFVNFHFIISGVTRGFTHQMVRQRTATYTQESTRFAVKEEVPVGRPPSLDGTVPWEVWWDKCGAELFPILVHELNLDQIELIDKHAKEHASKEQLWRKEWDSVNERIAIGYNDLVNSGMPAEDARGLLPTNLLTRINYNTSLRGLKEHAGVRLCTQAQYEWRLVWMEMLKAIREYGKTARYLRPIPDDLAHLRTGHLDEQERMSRWQFEALADIFKPICYYKGKCQFMSDVDRACKIRDRVEANASWGIPSSEWHKGTMEYTITNEQSEIPPIHDSEWMLDPKAARVPQ
jgi:flavin-dependent thymidylate synthase